MLKKYVLASLAALGLAIPLTATPAAQPAYIRTLRGNQEGLAIPLAATPVAQAAYHGHGRHHHCRYEVEYRDCGRDPWRVRGVYESSRRAREAAEHLRHRGFEVRIVEC